MATATHKVADYELTDYELAETSKGIPVSHTTHIFQEDHILLWFHMY